jgi:hypothetical protein
MLLILGLSVATGDFPVEVLRQVDAAVAAAGFRKEVSSVVKPGKEYSITYEGPDMQRRNIEGLLKPVIDRHHLTLSIETEESVRFP